VLNLLDGSVEYKEPTVIADESSEEEE